MSDGVRCVSTIPQVTGKKRLVAQILLVVAAVATTTTSATKPRNSNPHANAQAVNSTAYRVDVANDLVTRNDGKPGVWELTVNEMKVRPTNAASGYADTNFV
jgi:hypothetical protein